jgi:hypothetical protein
MPLPKEQFLPKAAKAELAGREADLKSGGLPELLRKAGKEMYDNAAVNAAIGFTPGAGDIQAAVEALRSAKEGDWTGAALNGVGVLPFVPALAGTFVGKGSKTWDAVQAAEALKRIDAGEDAAKVWKETGYGVAPWDKMARSEIPDADAKFKMFPIDRDVSLGSAVSHGKASDAYPDIFESTRFNYAHPSTIPGFNGSLGKNAIGEDLIVLSQKQGLGDEGKSTVLHELQHAIQGNEGFARGGSPDTFAKEAMLAGEEISQVNKQMSAIVKSMDAAKASGDKAKYEKYRQMYDEAMDYKLSELVPKAQIDPYDAYRQLGGEAEARLTQARMKMTPEERLAQYPYDPKYFEEATGVPLNKLIARFDKGDWAAILERNGNPIAEALRNPAAPRAAEFEEARKEGVRLLGLPENNTAMDRARAMGFEDAYHGTKKDITEFNPDAGTGARSETGSWLTKDPELANTYANSVGGGNVMPLMVRTKGFGEVDAGGRNWNRIDPDTVVRHSNGTDSAVSEYMDKLYDDFSDTNTLAQISRAEKDKGLHILEVRDRGPHSHGVSDDVGLADNMVVFDPTAIRSRFAAFNPAKKDSTNILAGVGAGGLGLAAALRAAQEEEQYQ